MQSTSKILMVRPANFGFNEETAVNNSFQVKGYGEDANIKALVEFDKFAARLRENGVDLYVVNDTPEPQTPDSIFPNNWFSTHEGGTLVLYPMFAPNRRAERKEVAIGTIKKVFNAVRIVDLTTAEENGKFLEGTGSMVIDRDNDIVFACRSPRSDEDTLMRFCEELDYDYYMFDASDGDGNPIYHTNVMLSIGNRFAVVCLDAIKEIDERVTFIDLLEENDKEIIEISLEQMANFAGNMLEIKSMKGEPILVMSKRAKSSLDKEQLSALGRYCKILAVDLEYIENNGGGSARCMMAEIY